MLYQKHASQRIPRVLQGLGYPIVQELKLNKWTPLRGGVEVMCGSAGSTDSWVAIRAEGSDCGILRQTAFYLSFSGTVPG